MRALACGGGVRARATQLHPDGNRARGPWGADASPVHKRPGVQRGKLLPRPLKRPHPLPLPDLQEEEEALPSRRDVLSWQPLQQQYDGVTHVNIVLLRCVTLTVSHAGACVPKGDTIASDGMVLDKRDMTAWMKKYRTVSGKGQAGDPCLVASDCSDSLCCARHLWTRFCKPVLREGQVCSRRGRKKRQRDLELFQRCSCGRGLACHTGDDTAPSSSTLLMTAKSKFAAHSPVAPQARLHVCRRK
ncbi:uncharacterized protein LOC133661926 isoform X1 [Entelurus aequoreus]|uniref:uncharacterized protein LOC133661926 isoform X1 n=1 Tax=Entelurus aequoreus TaxID=161455 RepID=UPI002B1E79A2|nr:uncharacterized protein LOC133661926 isoform X1 [Entelurus aequoreus]